MHQLRKNLEWNKKQTGKLYDCIKWQYRIALYEYIRPDLKWVEIYNTSFYTSWESDLLNLRWHFPSIFYLFHIHCQFSIYCMNQCELDLLAVVLNSQQDDIKNKWIKFCSFFLFFFFLYFFLPSVQFVILYYNLFVLLPGTIQVLPFSVNKTICKLKKKVQKKIRD